MGGCLVVSGLGIGIGGDVGMGNGHNIRAGKCRVKVTALLVEIPAVGLRGLQTVGVWSRSANVRLAEETVKARVPAG